MSEIAEEQKSVAPVVDETAAPDASAVGETPDGEEVVEEKSTKICDMIAEYLAQESEESKQPLIAFEYYPPRTKEAVQGLYERFTRMEKQKPLYADVTWGAGGSTSDLTLELCINAKEKHGLEPNMHLTCTNMEVEKIEAALKGAKEAGIRNIVALRGDPPKGEEKWEATEGGFTCALDLVKYMRKEYDDYFCISVAGYPEGHPNVIKKIDNPKMLTEAEKKRIVHQEDGDYVCHEEDYNNEIAYLKQKVDAGADMIITQMFFDIDVFLQFVADCRAAEIMVPIIPGIMLIMAYGGFKRMTGFCKSRVPEDVMAKVEELKGDSTGLKAYGIEFATEMSNKLIEANVPDLHYYTLNREETVNKILLNIGRSLTEKKEEPVETTGEDKSEPAVATE